MSSLSPYTGLTDTEVLESRKLHGENKSDLKERSGFWFVVLEIIKEPLFVILFCASLIYFLLGEKTEGSIMIVALIFVSGISVFQEHRSRNAVNALKKLSSALSKVIRNGKQLSISPFEIVVDDIIMLEDGNIVPADAEILKMNDLSINESILTGESIPVTKNKDSDTKLFQGTLILSGSCVARVTAIGKQTALGKISESLIQIETSKTPLQIQIKSFITSMVIVGSIAFLIVFGINFYLSKSFYHGLLQGLTLAMSILPEEIPVAFSTFMALGAYHLNKKKVIAKSPYTVETLGAASVICIDKTGTITENKMQLVSIYNFKSREIFDYTKTPYTMNEVLEYAVWSSETEPFDQMEKSIHAIYGSVCETDQRLTFSMIHEYPLGGTPPIMTHVFSNQKDKPIIASKGSVEGIIRQCKLSEKEKEEITHTTKFFASKGYRVLGVAKAEHDVNRLPQNQEEFEFEFLGLLAFNDPPKQNMREILKTFYKAGISVKIITGDYAETTQAIAEQIEFTFDKVLIGSEVMKLDSEELKRSVSEVNLFARMFPDAKLKVIEALKSNGEIVAMTGDGVNDAPALKAAHIGIAMGIRGSEVAKNAASLILVDDNLFQMTEAVALGRKIYENLKKAIQYIISIHIPIILIVTLPLLFLWDFTSIFSPVHVIFLELIMGPTCSIIFENEPIEANSMNKKPRTISKRFFSFPELSFSIIQGIAITIACLGTGYYYMQHGASETLIRTLIYTTLIFSNVFLTLVNRSFYYSIVSTIKYKNKLIPFILSISVLILFTSIYYTPLQNVFKFESLSVQHILICLSAASISVLWAEGYKFYKRKIDK